MDRAVEELDSACSANGLACTKSEQGLDIPIVTTHECASGDPKVTGAACISDSEGPKRERKKVVGFLAHAPRARGKLESK